MRWPCPPIGGQPAPPMLWPITRHTQPAKCERVISTPEKPVTRTENDTHTGEFEMTTHLTRSLTRYIALPAVSAGILAGAALGMAGMANAGTYSYQPSPRPGMVVTPNTKAQPPATATPGARWHRDHHRFAIN